MRDSFDDLESKTITLAVNQPIDGVVLLGGTNAKVHANGRLMEGVLAFDQEVNGLKLAALFRVRLRPDSSLERCMLKSAQQVGALYCAGGVQFYADGRVKFATLAQSHLISGFPVAKADFAGFGLTEVVDLHDSSMSKEFLDTLGERWMHQEGMLDVAARSVERNYWKARTLEFFENGRLKFLQLGAEHTVGSTHYSAGSFLEFTAAGEIASNW